RGCAAASLACDELAELADREPAELAGGDELAKLGRFLLRLGDMVGCLDCGTQHGFRVDLVTGVGIGAGDIDVAPSASHSDRHTGSADLVMVTTTSARPRRPAPRVPAALQGRARFPVNAHKPCGARPRGRKP